MLSARPVIPGPSGPGLLPMDRTGPVQSGTDPWESLVIHCDINELFENIAAEINDENSDKAVSTFGLCKIIKF